jgi:histidinol dehydrogenase
VYDFVKRTSLIRYSGERLAADASHIIALAEAEGLMGHAEAVRVRFTGAENPAAAPASRGDEG